ncbi:Cyclic nucleotide-gated ion channel 4 [Nymphaea thermarum]|nr:Cyclic nucleotide-gated ion channel 4 [Nymphaea thermarum]
MDKTEEGEEEEDSHTSSHGNGDQTSDPKHSQGIVLDPRSRLIQEWNKVFLLISGVGSAVDPLFFYTLSVSSRCNCVYIDGWLALTVTALRCMADFVHLWHIWLQLRLAYAPKPSLVAMGGGGRLQSHPRKVALHYLKSKKGFLLDAFVILPLPHLVVWVVAPNLIANGKTTWVMTVFLVTFLFQYLPKLYHATSLLRRMNVFGTIWWGFSLNMMAYFVAAHASGACWYLLGIQRAAKCLKEQCLEMDGCGLKVLGCKEPIYYGVDMVRGGMRMAWAAHRAAGDVCLASSDKFNYGAYKWVVPLVTSTNRLEKVLFPIFWGLMTLSTFGNLESTTEWSEVVFNIIILTSGLVLVTMLIGNIKVFLHATTSKKQKMQLKMRNLEWWMKRRQLPQGFRQRVRQYERQRWAAMRGVDESNMIRNLPEGLRRDIKYHLCLDLVRQARSLITKEGEPVERMLFVLRGHLQSTQVLRDGVKSCCMLGPGNFSGDELLSWCLRRPFVERLPPSSFTLVSLETTEAFGLEAADLKYVTQHFRYNFTNEKVRRSARYYSPGWRTWAAVAIQLAWRRYRHRLTLTSLSFIRPRRPLSRSSSLKEDRLRLYTAMLTSPKPDQEDFSF